MELADTSAWVNRRRDPAVAADFETRLLAGEIATCAIVKMELLWSARDGDDFRALRERLDALDDIPIDAAVWTRALDVSQELASKSLDHRRVRTPALVVAAAAELDGIPVCHCDDDFERIASATGQPARRLA
jgi:predicted nucleic acid-binding protein